MSRDQELLLHMIDTAGRIVAFTGAGISTECGIPDFRSPGGLWSRYRPIDFQTFLSSPEMRREGLARFLGLRAAIGPVAPGRGHRAVVALHAQGKLTACITQNIDGLHQAAGLPAAAVIELHGNGTYAHCLACGRRHELDWVAHALAASPEAPACVACGGIVKTATISFGQPMPPLAMARAEAASRDCDLFVVLGSSLVVHPAAGLPVRAAAAGARLVIVNREPTPLDGLAELVVRADIGDLLAPLIAG